MKDGYLDRHSGVASGKAFCAAVDEDIPAKVGRGGVVVGSMWRTREARRSPTVRKKHGNSHVCGVLDCGSGKGRGHEGLPALAMVSLP